MTAMEQPGYKVLSPVGSKTANTSRPLSQLADLNGKTICELDGRAFRANETLSVIRRLLQERYPRAKFVKAGEIFSPSSQDQAAGLREKSLADLSAAFEQYGVDAVITGNGA
jgi:hypothetical protein